MAETPPMTIVYKQLPESTPWWIYAVSIGGGLLVLLLLSFGLLKMGFFKRKQKEELEKLTKEVNPNLTACDNNLFIIY